MAPETRYLQSTVARSARTIVAMLDQIEEAAAALPRDPDAVDDEPRTLEARLEIFWRIFAEEWRPVARRLAASTAWRGGSSAERAGQSKKGRGKSPRP